jgi:predicted negative regulator of RcsB-dependent stress response
MPKTIAKQPKREQVDTEDRIMETVASVTMWARRNRRAATTVLVALVAVVAAGVIYVRYKSDLQERAAVRLDQIRLSSQGTAPQQLREDLGIFVAQFSGTPEAAEARLLLAEFEMRRDSVAAAIRALEPVANAGLGTPVSYHAATMIAAAQEQLGDAQEALKSYQRLESDAPYAYQRRSAKAAQARLHEFSGEYGEAARIYQELVSDEDSGTDGAFYAVRLGEVLARAKARLPAPAVPVIEARVPATAEVDVSGADEEAVAEE